MYYPLSPSYIPEIHPTNLSFVTPSPESYLQFLQSTPGTIQQSNLPNKNGSRNGDDTTNVGLNNNLFQFPNPTREAYYDDITNDCPFINDENAVRGLKAGAYWLYTGSILLLLACNIIFLIWIMKVRIYLYAENKFLFN